MGQQKLGISAIWDQHAQRVETLHRVYTTSHPTCGNNLEPVNHGNLTHIYHIYEL